MFWDLTPEELERIVLGWQRRQEDEWERMAWLAAHMLAPWSKKKLTPDKLLGPSFAASKRRRRGLPPLTEEGDD
jgi:hypothetical protein